MRNIEEQTNFSIIRNYYNQVYSQTGIKPFIKKKLFGNLLNVLVVQEDYLSETEKQLTETEKRLTETEKRLTETEKRLSETEKRLSYRNPLLLREKHGLLIDVTYITKQDLGTGIQRVVKNIFNIIYNYKKEKNVMAVCMNQGKLTTSYGFSNQFEEEKEKHNFEVVFHEGDKLFLLDSSWEYVKDFSELLDIAKEHNVKSYALIYDLFPIQYPEFFESQGFVEAFCAWHDMVLQKTSVILCDSRTTADTVVSYYKKMKFRRNSPLNLYFFHMGSNVTGRTQEARFEIQDFAKSGKTFLMVGTVEPRKGHMVALKAFSKILKESKDNCRLLIIGHDGWKNDDIRNRLALPEYKDKGLWIQDASDEELCWAYNHVDALIAASKDEGFGLPLVEAAHFGLPIICSDIPIFREVTQGNADYFKVMDADDLARCITEWLQTAKHPDSSNIHIYTWQESAQEILDIIDGKVEPYKVLQ